MKKLTLCTCALGAFCSLALVVEPQGYAAHQTITVSGYAGEETLANFPVLLRLPASYFQLANQADLTIIDADGNLLAHEVDSVSDGKVLVWVRVPALANGTQLTAYFGKNSADASIYTAADVWTDKYAAVWHLNSANPTDATGHELEQTAKDANQLTLVSDGPLGNAIRLSANSSAVVFLKTPKADFIDKHITDVTKLTLTGWMIPAKTVPTKATRIFCWKANTVNPGFDTFQNTDGKFYLRGGDKGTTCKTLAAMGWSTTDWHHVAALFDGTAAYCYLDGAALATEGSVKAVSVGEDGANNYYLGYGNIGGKVNLATESDFQYPFGNGTLDELRIYNGVASADWVKAEYDAVMKTGFLTYGDIEAEGEVEGTDGVWISSAAEANWSDPANWQDGKLPTGAGATVTFASPAEVTEQRVVLGADVPLTALVQNDGVARTIAGGKFAFVSAADFTVAGGSLNFADPFYSGALVKKGAGTLTFAETATIAGDLTVEGGELAFAQTTGEVLAPAEDGTFTPEAALWVTHVGFVDAAGQTDPVRLTVATRTLPTEEGAEVVDTLKIQTRWVAQAPGFVRDGVRYQRLPEPVELTAGTLYVMKATNGSAGRLLIAKATSVIQVNGLTTVAAGATLSATTPVVTLHGLAGAGCLAAPGDEAVAFDNTQSADTAFAGSTAGHVALIERGKAQLALAGTGLFPDGVTFRAGEVRAAATTTLDPAALLVFGDGTGANECGRYTLAGSGELSPAVGALRATTTGLTAMGLGAAAGTTLTVRGAVFSDLDRDVPFNNAKSNEMALHAPAAETAEQDPTIEVVESTIAYLDLAARVDGRAVAGETRPNNKIAFEANTTTPDYNRVRKFTVQNNTVDSLGGTVEFRGEVPFVTDWFDIVGAQTAVVQQPGTTVEVKNDLRFSDSTPSWETIKACDTDWTIGDGAQLIVNAFPTAVQNGNNSNASVLRFDGGTLKMNKSATAVRNLFPLASRMPVVLTEKGATVDLVPNQGGAAVAVNVYAPLSGAGALTLTGDETRPQVTFAAPASYTGGTVAQGVALALDAPLAAGSDLTLADGATLKTTAPTVRLGTLASEADLAVDVGANADLWVKTLDGATTIAKTGDGQLGLLLAHDDEPMPETTLNVAAGTLALTMDRAFVEPTLVADGDFEPAEPITTGGTADRDRRAKKGKTYFEANLTSWTFDPADDTTGIASDGSYFTTNGQLAMNGGAANQHCAYLRRSSATAAARTIAREFKVEAANTEVTITFDWNVRWPGDGKPYFAKLGLLVDGDQVYETESLASSDQNEVSVCGPKYKSWQRATVKLTLPAGTHTLAFQPLTPVADGVEKPCEALLDNVRIGTSYALGGTAATQLKSVTLNVAAGAKLHLDDGFVGKVGAVTYNGTKIRDTITAATQPDFVTGGGRLTGPRMMTIFIR